MLRLLPHDDDDDDDSRDDLIFEISMEFSRKLLFLLLSRFQKEQRCFTNHTNATIDKALFFFFFFQNVKRSLLLAKRRKGSGERIHTESAQSGAKKLLFRVMQERKKERRDQKTKKSEKKAETFFCTEKETKHASLKCIFLLIQIIERERG